MNYILDLRGAVDPKYGISEVYMVRHKFCDNFDKCGQKAEILTYIYKFHSFFYISAST